MQIYVVNVAQLVEHQVVALRVVGSIPTVHPNIKFKDFQQMFTQNSPATLGLLFILFGLSLITRDLPMILRIMSGIIIMFTGFWLLAKSHHGQSFYFLSGEKEPQEGSSKDRYSLFFASKKIDLTTLDTTKAQDIVIEGVSSSVKVLIDPAKPIKITADASLASVRFPDETMITLGTYTYRTPGFEEQPQVHVYIKATLSEIKIKNI